MRKSVVLLICFAVMKFVAAGAQPASIAPTPHHAQWSGQSMARPAAVKIIGENVADSDAVRLLRKSFAKGKGSTKIILGKRGDKAVKRFTEKIPQHSEGYYLSIGPKTIVLAGNDERGTYYAAQTLAQLASQPTLPIGEITDWPDVAERGLVEGYYGNPYSDADRRSMFEFFGEMKMNTYIYGPKDDAFHRSRWREAYPEADAKRISQYVSEARRHKVNFVWAIHPGGDIKWTRADSLAIVGKLEKMYELGVRAFAVFFDDIGGEGTDPKRQAGLLNYISEKFIDRHSDAQPLILCPTQYNRAWSGGDYLDILGQTCRKDIRIMWTGNSVVDMIDRQDMEWINARLRRNAYIWLNYPVNDYCIGHLLMGRTYGNDLDIAPLYGGFTANPMEYAEASKVSLFSIADYCWNTKAYDSQSSWEKALRRLMPTHTEAFRRFCESNIDLGKTYHGLRREGESPTFRAAEAEAKQLMGSGDTAKAIKTMRQEFQQMASAADELMHSSENKAMVEEITPWCKVMKIVAERGLTLQTMEECLMRRDSVKFIDNYLKYRQLEEEQAKVRSRDFKGSVKSPNPEVATTYVMPYLKQTTATLIQRYKSANSYRRDVFPVQTVENGIYFIKYNGRYLTNSSPNAGGSSPTLVARRDDIKPQSQEWSIALDPSTDRYRIVSQLDSRYLNEAARFSVSMESNPYDAAWHTFTISKQPDGRFAIRNGGSGGNAFWTVDAATMTIAPARAQTTEKEASVFEIIPAE